MQPVEGIQDTVAFDYPTPRAEIGVPKTFPSRDAQAKRRLIATSFEIGAEIFSSWHRSRTHDYFFEIVLYWTDFVSSIDVRYALALK